MTTQHQSFRITNLLAPLQAIGLVLSVFCCGLIYRHVLDEWQQLQAEQQPAATVASINQQGLVGGEVKSVQYGSKTFQEQQFRYVSPSAQATADVISPLPEGHAPEQVQTTANKTKTAALTVVGAAFRNLVHSLCKNHRGGLFPLSDNSAPDEVIACT